VRSIVVAVIMAAALAGCSSTTPTTAVSGTPTATHSAPVVTPAPAAAADAVDPTTLSNNGWKVATFNMKDDGAGNFGATARIVNATGSDKKASAFTMTVLDASKSIVATLVGSAMSVAKDATVTVQFASTDPYKAGTYLYAFQCDGSY